MQRQSNKKQKQLREARTKARFEAKEVTAEFTLATEEQKATIQALKAKIDGHVISVNRPYSYALSMLVTTVTVGPLALHQYNPINYLLYKRFTQPRIARLHKIIDEDYEARNSIAPSFQKLCAMLEEKFYEKFFKKPPPKGNLLVNVYEALGELDRRVNAAPTHESYTSDLKKLFMEYANSMHKMRTSHLQENNPEMEKFAKKNRFDLLNFNNLPPDLRKHITENYPTYKVTSDIDNFTSQKLFLETSKTISDFTTYLAIDKEYHSSSNQLQKLFVAQKIRAESDNILFPFHIALTLAIQFSIVDYGFRLNYPYGVFENNISTECISESQANQVIKLLIDNEASTGKIAGRNKWYARFFSFFVIPFACVLLSSTDEPSPEVIIFAVSLAMAAARNFCEDALDYFADDIETALKKSEARIDELLAGHNYTRSTLQNDILSASQITINFKSTSGTGIAPEKVASAFVDSLDHHNVPIISLHQNKVKLTANFVENASMLRRGYHFTRRTFRRPDANDATVKLAKIRKTFQQNIARHNDILALKKQIKKLLTATSGTDTRFVQISKTDKNGLPDITIEFNLPDWMKDFTQELSEIFANSAAVKVANQANKKINVLIEQFTSVDEAKLQTLIEKIKLNRKKQQNTVQVENKSEVKSTPTPKTVSAEPEVVKPPKRWQLSTDESKKEHQPETKDETPDAIQERLANRLGATVIADAPIYPISNSQVRDYKSYTNSTHFVRNCLDRNKVPEELYNAVQSAVQNAEFAAPKGEQGFLFWEHRERDQNRKRFMTSLKLKFLGKRFGDIRVMARKVVTDAKNDNGVLHEIVGVCYKAHKTQGR